MHRKTLLSILLLIGIVMLTHQAWLLSLSTIIGSDWGFFYPITMQEWFPLHSIWNSQLNFGYYDFISVPFLLTYILRSSLSVLQIDFNIIDRLLYLYPVAFLAPLSMFLLSYQLTKNRAASLIAALVYTLNTYYLTIQIGHFTLAFVYALFPVIFMIFRWFLEKPKYLKLLLLLFLIFLAFSNEARITFLCILILFFYFIYSITFKRRDFPINKTLAIVKYIILGGLIFIAIISFMIVPFLFYKEIGVVLGSGRGFFGAVFFPIQNAFTLFHPFWSGEITTEFIPQPIPFYFWLFPLIAFSALFFHKKDSHILFFALLALIGVFLGKGITDPLGNIYNWLYSSIPGFSFFREPSKFYFIIAFSYSILFAYTTVGLFQLVEKKYFKGYKGSIIKIVYIIPLIFLFSVIASPVFHKTLGDAFRETYVPNEYTYLKDFLVNQKEFFRTMYVPNYQRFQVLTNNHPSIAYYGIPAGLQSIDPNILKLYSVKYVILPFDSTKDVYKHYAPREIWEREISEMEGLQKISDSNLGGIGVYINTKGYLPHIYAADNEIYIKGDPELLDDIASLLPNKKNSIYFSEALENTGKNFEKQKHTLLENSYISTTCIRCDDTKPWENFDFPFANYLPNSPVYSYIKKKEQDELTSLKADQQAYNLKVAFYSMKRILEAQRIIELNINIEYLKRVLKDHQQYTQILHTQVDQVTNDRLQNNDYLLKLRDSVEVEQKIIGDLMVMKREDEEFEISDLLEKEYYQLDTLHKKLTQKVWASNDNVIRYTVDLPEATTAEIIAKKNSTYPEYTFTVGNETVTNGTENNGWISFGEKQFEKGLNPLSITIKNERNLVATAEATYRANADEGVKKYTLPITNFAEAEDIVVRFSYHLIQGKPVRVFVSQDADRIQNGVPEVSINQYLLNEKDWNDVWSVVTRKNGAKNASLEFWVEGEGSKDAILQIKDLRVEAVVKPLLLLKQKGNTPSSSSTQVRINTIDATHYQAIITQATDPYTLVFNEQFHNGWHASINNNVIPDANHVSVNGFANAWFIDKKGDYVVDIYFTPQKYYTIGVWISLISLLLILISAIYFRKK